MSSCKPNIKTIIIGTYTPVDSDKGIYIINYNIDTMSIIDSFSIPATNPSYMKYFSEKKILMYVEEIGDNNGKIKTIKVDFDNQNYSVISEQLTEGSSPCHLCIDPDRDHIIVSNYKSGNFTTFSMDKEGNLSKPLSNYTFKGQSKDPIRQQTSHIHSAFFSPNGKRVFIQDLGADRIYQFDVNKIYQNNEDHKQLMISSGSGPRHVAFSSKPMLYLVNELTATIDVYSLNEEEEADTLLQTLSLSIDPTDERKNLAAHIQISSDERFLYVSNRGKKNELIVFSTNTEGLLTHLQTISSSGKGPRHFEFINDQKFVLVANQYSNNICIFKRDETTGILEDLESFIEIPTPVFVSFVN